MKIVSVNVWPPWEVGRKGITVQTAIFKKPVVGAVAIQESNLGRVLGIFDHGSQSVVIRCRDGSKAERLPRPNQLPQLRSSCTAVTVTKGQKEHTLTREIAYSQRSAIDEPLFWIVCKKHIPALVTFV